MSYLDFPRLHFGGLFYTNPNTINNTTTNYTPTVNLEVPPPPPNTYNRRAGWNPLGVAQWWLEECTVLSAVGPSGAAVNAGDPVVGAAVWSPSPKTPMEDGSGGFYDIAKMVDLDPDQQGRSAIYGLRISVTLPGGAGLQGLMTVTELRQLNGRIAGVQGSWGAVGNWMGTLQPETLQWSGDISGSTFLTDLKNASGEGLAVKLTVDLHQNNPANVFTAGDIFCYGRVLGSIGPALAGELAQVVPGRCVQTFTPPSRSAAAVAQSGVSVVQGRERVAALTQALGQQRAAAGSTRGAAAPDPWNPAFAVVRQPGSQSLLSIDIGGSILLNASPAPPQTPTASDGTFEVESGIAVGVVDNNSGQFTAFENGDLDFSQQYQPSNSTNKNCQLVKNSGVFTIPLTASDGDAYQTNPLAIQVNGTTVALENPSGLWADVSVSSERLECGGGQPGSAQLMMRVFGNPPPAGTTPPFSVAVALFNWQTGAPQLTPSTDIGISIGQTDADGLAQITTNVNAAGLTLPAVRQPLDSEVYYVTLSDPLGNVIGDGSATLSVLLWNLFNAPSNPTWNDVGAVFDAYARLYPGMKSRLDISDEATVVGFAGAILGRMDIPFTDPAYMPVTRDLSPSKMAMITAWLAQQVSQQKQSANGSQSGGEA